MSNSILESELTLHTRPAAIIQPRFSATGNCLGITVAGLCRQPDSSPFQSWKVLMSHTGHRQQNTKCLSLNTSVIGKFHPSGLLLPLLLFTRRLGKVEILML